MLPSGQRHLLSFPMGDTIGLSTLDALLGDDGLGTYAETWAVFEYDITSPQPGYRQLALDDSVDGGSGYWIIQVTGNPVALEIDRPDVDLNVETAAHGDCEAPITLGPAFEPRWTSVAVDDDWEFPLANGPDTPIWSSSAASRVATRSERLHRRHGRRRLCRGLHARPGAKLGVFYTPLFGWEPDLNRYRLIGDFQYLTPWHGFCGMTNVQGGPACCRRSTRARAASPDTFRAMGGAERFSTGLECGLTERRTWRMWVRRSRRRRAWAAADALPRQSSASIRNYRDGHP